MRRMVMLLAASGMALAPLAPAPEISTAPCAVR